MFSSLRNTDILTHELADTILKAVSKEFHFKGVLEVIEENLDGQIRYFANENPCFTIAIDDSAIKTVGRFVSVLCHELGHLYMIRHHIYQNAHFKPNEDASVERLRSYVQTALKCELKADSIGRKYCSQIFPDIEFQSIYGIWKVQKMFREQEVMPYKKKLEELKLQETLKKLDKIA